MIVGLFILGLCIWFAGLFAFVSFFCDDNDEGEVIILALCLLVFGGLIMYEAKDPDAVAKHIRNDIDRVNRRINEARVDCKELNITEEQCDGTFLYKLKREKADLEVQLKETIMEKYRD